MIAFGQVMNKCLEKVAVMTQEQMSILGEKHASNQIDEEDLDKVYAELDKLTGVSIYINECCDIMMTTYGKDVGPLLDQNVKFYFAGVLKQYTDASERGLQDALYFFINYV
jgi:hypothetical protein